MMDLDWIRRLLELVDDSDVDSLEIRRFGTHVTVRKSPPSSAPSPSPPAPATPPEREVAGADGPEAGKAPDAAAGAEEAEEPAEELIDVESPMVGTFYRAPAPDAPPYVEVGDHVGKGQTLCILEAMKLMNELESEVEGEIREIRVQNAEPVEYGQVLFRIRPSG